MRGGIISLRGLSRYAWLRTSSEVNFRRPALKPSIKPLFVGQGSRLYRVKTTAGDSETTQIGRRERCDLPGGSSCCRTDFFPRGRIYKRPVRQHTRARRKLRSIDLVQPHDVHHRNALRQQVIGNDAAVATPPHRFSAHDRAAIVTGQRSQLIQSRSECFTCRVIGIVSEGGDLPECIERWRRALLPVPQTAKSRQMSVGYSSTGERFGESLGVELRICPRARDGTHIDEQIDGYLLEQSQEFANRTR